MGSGAGTGLDTRRPLVGGFQVVANLELYVCWFMQSGRALAVAVTLAGSSNIVRMLRQLSSTLKEITFLQWLLLKDGTLSGSRSASSAGVDGRARCRGHLHLFLYFFAALCSPSWSSAFVFFNLFSSSVLATMVICISFFLFLQLCARYHGRPHFFRLTIID